MSAPDRVFTLRMSERCFRFKPDALPSHAPPKPGVYEFVTFKDGNPEVLYVGLALEKNVYDCLSAHLTGQAEPTAAELFAAAKDVYFDYVADADISGLDDLRDIARALVLKHKPRFNTAEIPGSGKYAEVNLKELD